MSTFRDDTITFPDPPAEGSPLQDFQVYLETLKDQPVAHGVVEIDGYTFFLDLPHSPFPPPAVWYLTACSPSSARDTQRVRPKLGFQWCWHYAIDTISQEFARVQNAVPTPDPGPFPPPF